ncbi:MAG: 30S ribosomal protein S6 [Elusimicrobiota bacterium]|jgi:small subunit ribosomal protein S6|nr:30S ribosomal protein S6 [Elusimicrobiota bacterium]
MKYESVFICQPDLTAEKVEELISKTSKIIETENGQIKSVQQLGRKKLAYPIKTFREGIYVLIEFEAGGETVGKLENFFKLNDAIIRFLTVKSLEKKNAAKLPEQSGVSEVKNEPAK